MIIENCGQVLVVIDVVVFAVVLRTAAADDVAEIAA